MSGMSVSLLWSEILFVVPFYKHFAPGGAEDGSACARIEHLSTAKIL